MSLDSRTSQDPQPPQEGLHEKAPGDAPQSVLPVPIPQGQAALQTAPPVVVIGNVQGDGGGILIYGNGKVVRLPPWKGPEGWREVFASLALLDRVEAERDPFQLRGALERHLVELASQVRSHLTAQHPSRPTKELAAALVFMSPGVSRGGSGWVITAGGALKKIDPHGPPQLRQLYEAAHVLQYIPSLPAHGGSSAGKPQPDPWRGLMTSVEASLTAAMRKVQAEVDALP